MKWLIFLITFMLYNFARSEFLEEECTSTGWSCLNCFTRKYCRAATGPYWSKTPCLNEITNNQFPYCDPANGRCVSYEADVCRSIAPDTCVREGQYPDIFNCTRYFTCDQDKNITLETCPLTHYYHSGWAKCIFRVGNCPQVTCTTNSIFAYPEDKSLFYECSGGAPTLEACPSITDVYDVQQNRCVSICNASSVGNLPNSRDCKGYYKCSLVNNGYQLQKFNCVAPQGFNPRTRRCEPRYNQICNELAILEKTVERLSNLVYFPVGRYIFLAINSLFTLFRFNPFSLILIFGVSPDNLSTGILFTNYLVENRNIPPAIINNMVQMILNYLPESIRNLVDTVLRLIGSRSRAKRDIDMNLLKTRLEYIFRNINIDFESIASDLSTKTFSQLINDLGEYFVRLLNINESDLPHVKDILHKSMPIIVDYINVFYFNLLKYADSTLQIDVNRLFVLFNIFIQTIAQELGQHNYLMSQMFLNIVRQYQQAHYQDVQNFFDPLNI